MRDAAGAPPLRRQPAQHVLMTFLTGDDDRTFGVEHGEACRRILGHVIPGERAGADWVIASAARRRYRRRESATSTASSTPGLWRGLQREAVHEQDGALGEPTTATAHAAQVDGAVLDHHQGTPPVLGHVGHALLGRNRQYVPPEGRSGTRRNGRVVVLHVGQTARHAGETHRGCSEPAADDEPLDLVGALEDLGDLGFAHVALDGEARGSRSRRAPGRRRWSPSSRHPTRPASPPTPGGCRRGPRRGGGRRRGRWPGRRRRPGPCRRAGSPAPRGR